MPVITHWTFKYPTHTESVVFCLCTEKQSPAHTNGPGSQRPPLKKKKNHPERDVFVFPSGLNSQLKVFRTENHCQPSPILTIGCQATLPPRRPFLEPLYRRICARHDSGRLKGADVSILNDCKSAALTQSDCCRRNCWLMISTSNLHQFVTVLQRHTATPQVF